MYGSEKKVDFEPSLDEDWVTSQLCTINTNSTILLWSDAMYLSIDQFLIILRTKCNYLKRLNNA